MEFLTVPEAATRLRLGRSTVYLMCQRGALPTVKFGTAVRIPIKALDEWLEQQVRQPLWDDERGFNWPDPTSRGRAS